MISLEATEKILDPYIKRGLNSAIVIYVGVNDIYRS